MQFADGSLVERDENLPRDVVDELVMMRERARPPARDAGIASETDWAIDLGEEEGAAASGRGPEDGEGARDEDWVCEMEGGDGWFWRKTGIDRGENGFRCRWTAMGGASDCSGGSFASIRALRDEGRVDSECGFSWKETWWEKADSRG